MRACARAPSAMLMTSTPPSLEHLRGGERLREVEPDGRVDLDRDDELPARDLRGERAALRERRASRRRRARRAGSADHAWNVSLPRASRVGLGRRALRRRSADHARGGGDALHVLGRRAAAAADQLARRACTCGARRRRSTRASTRRRGDRRRGAAARRWAPPRPGRPGSSIGCDGLEHVHRAVGAVDADDVAPHSFMSRAISAERRAVGHAAVLVDRDRGDDRHLAAGGGDARPRSRRAARRSGASSRRASASTPASTSASACSRSASRTFVRSSGEASPRK